MQVNIVIMVSLQQKSTDVDRHAITAQQQKLHNLCQIRASTSIIYNQSATESFKHLSNNSYYELRSLIVNIQKQLAKQ